MKKLMIALAVAAIAVASQAATVNWKSGASVQGPAADGTFNGTTLAKGSWTMYVWDNLTSSEYAALDISSKDFYTTWSAKTDSAIDKGIVIGTTSLGATAKNTAAADDKDYYAAILFTYTDEKGNDWYIANKATVHTDSLGNGATLNNLAKNIGGGSGTAIAGWTAAAVPEPTSGLLLLLGVAGLALRRRRA